ncbi:Bgt-2402-2 [Blumeria graminis f. sp. tritici]|uniref:Bgt-2402-2 n=1 Tax=Blumeria graminis f. sp. tritici TaxID=62690 RepID=A0A9X9L766_BLUGR|nr:Bgt-2402-2 [Blumeria graminis f. sp. tritici]
MPPSNKNSTSAQQYPQETVPSTKQHERVTSHGTISQHDVEPMREVQQTSTTQYSNHSGPFTSTEPPQISSLSLHPSKTPPLSSPLQSSSISNFVGHSRNTNLPPLNPVFGLSLNRLSERDGSAVPMVVYQCIQAVDLFGLEVEGIYRLSGTASHVSKIKSLFDNDASKVDFRDPANFFHDVNSVAGLLKLFFRDLPDPLLTSAYYADFIEASKLENEILCRDSLHAIINNLPEPNYATLRAVILHLNRVQENSTVNRMNISNLAIVFGPSLMGANTGSNIQNAGWQVGMQFGGGQKILERSAGMFDSEPNPIL